jgi:hypothetical protein
MQSDVILNRITQLTNGNGSSQGAVTDRDGSSTAFSSTADNLASDDADAGEDVSVSDEADLPPTGRPAILQPVSGTQFLLVPEAVTPIRFAWTSVENAAQYALEFTGRNRAFVFPNTASPDPNGAGGPGGFVVVPGTSFTASLTADVPPGSYQVRVIGLPAAGDPGTSTFSDAVTVVLNLAAAGPPGQPTITAPADGAVLTPGTFVTFAWTVVPGATAYGFEFTGRDLEFLNPNDVVPDAVNGFGVVGGPARSRRRVRCRGKRLHRGDPPP